MTSTLKPILVSGVQPTQQLTLGNYLGALSNWKRLQEQYTCFFFIADLHALTVPQPPHALHESTLNTLATFLASGIDPEKCTFFVQSHVPAHAQLAWILTCLTNMGELNRMTQFKDKSQKAKSIGVGLFSYPTLMAADVLLYQADLVPVGHDQKQHLELTRDLAERMNQQLGAALVKVPKPFISPVGAKIRDLQNPELKMSKSSANPLGTLFLSDPPDLTEKKIKRAVTDTLTEIQFDPENRPGISNLLEIQAALLGCSPESLVGNYTHKLYGELKKDTAAAVQSTLAPIQKKREAYLRDPTTLMNLLRHGRETAQHVAQGTLERIFAALGLVPPA